MGVKYPCIHGDLCRAYMRKFGGGHIYSTSCPNCEFYEPDCDCKFECAAACTLASVLKDESFERGYREGRRSAVMAHALGLAC